MKKNGKDKPLLIFVDKVNNFSSLSQLLKEIATDEYEIKIVNEQTKIQPKSSIVNCKHCKYI